MWVYAIKNLLQALFQSQLAIIVGLARRPFKQDMANTIRTSGKRKMVKRQPHLSDIGDTP